MGEQRATRAGASLRRVFSSGNPRNIRGQRRWRRENGANGLNGSRDAPPPTRRHEEGENLFHIGNPGSALARYSELTMAQPRRDVWLIVIVVIAGFFAMGQAAAPVDTPEGRRRAADEFLVAVPVTEEISRIIHEMSERLPPDRREAFVAQMTQQVNMVYMKQLMFDGLVANLTAAELQGAARFYSSPEGKAVREKLPKVIDEIMPLIQAELSRTARRLSLPR